MAQMKDNPDDCVIHPHSNTTKLALDDFHKFVATVETPTKASLREFRQEVCWS
jgi:siderophore synthetase component